MSGKKRKRYDSRRIYVLIGIYAVATLIFAGVLFFILQGTMSDKEKIRDEGIAAMKNGSYASAVSLFRQSLDEKQWFSSEMDLDTRMYIGACHMRLREYQNAAEVYRALLSEKSLSDVCRGDAQSLLELAEANILAARMREAETAAPDDATIRELTELAANEPGMYLFLASAYNRREEYDHTVEAVENYLKSRSMNTYAAYELSAAHIRNGETAKADSVIKEGLACSDGVYKDLLQYEQVVLLEAAGSYEDAYSLAKTLHEQYPDNPDMAREYSFLDSRLNPDPTPVNPYNDALSDE